MVLELRKCDFKGLIDKKICVRPLSGDDFIMEVGEAGEACIVEGGNKSLMLLTDKYVPNSSLKKFKCPVFINCETWTVSDVEREFGIIGFYDGAWYIYVDDIESFKVIADEECRQVKYKRFN